MTLATRSTHIRANLVSMGGYIATFPHSILRAYADRFSLKALSIRPSGAPMASYRRDSEESNFESDRCTSSCMFEISRVRWGRRHAPRAAMRGCGGGPASNSSRLDHIGCLSWGRRVYHALLWLRVPAEARFGRTRSAGRTAEGRVLSQFDSVSCATCCATLCAWASASVSTRVVSAMIIRLQVG